VETPTTRQLRGLKLVGLIAPPASAGILARARGIVVLLILIAIVFGVAFGLITAIALPFGGLSLDPRIFYAILLMLIAVAVLAYTGRRRQRRAKAERQEQLAARSR
jgi:membrane protein implicated in regulation of membrane protease activity